MSKPPLWWPADINYPELCELSALSLILCASKCFSSYFSGLDVLLLFSKLFFPSVPWIYLPSDSSLCSIDHSFCYPGSLLPLPFLLSGFFLIWQSVAQMSPTGSLWLPWPQGDTPTFLAHWHLGCICVVSSLQDHNCILLASRKGPSEWV